MSRPPRPPWFNHPNNIWWRIQAVKFIIMQFSPWSIFLPFRSKYVLKYFNLATFSKDLLAIFNDFVFHSGAKYKRPLNFPVVSI
jgi:hypothetical protein